MYKLLVWTKIIKQFRLIYSKNLIMKYKLADFKNDGIIP